MTSGHFSQTLRADIRRLVIRSFALAMLGSLAIGFSSGLRAGDFQSITSGDWSNPGNWLQNEQPALRTPRADDYVDVRHAMIYDSFASAVTGATLNFYDEATRGDLILQKNMTTGSYQSGGATNLGAFTLEAGVISFTSQNSSISRSTGGRLIAGDNIGVGSGVTIELTGDDRTPAVYANAGSVMHLGSVGGNVTGSAVAEPGGVLTASGGYITPSTFTFAIRGGEPGGTVRFIQDLSDSTGVTISATGSDESISMPNPGGVIDLQFWSPSAPEGWALKWANPSSGGDRLSTLYAWKTSGALKVNGVAGTTQTPWPTSVTMWSADGFTYVGVVPEPSTLVLAACGVGAVALTASRRRRSA